MTPHFCRLPRCLYQQKCWREVRCLWRTGRSRPLAAMTAFAAGLLVVFGLHAHPVGADFAEWMMSLKQPDSPAVSCCGPADQVYVASYGPSEDKKNRGGFWAILPEGRRVEIPAKKVIWDRVNPTGRGVLFMGPAESYAPDGFVFCFVPGSGA